MKDWNKLKKELLENPDTKKAYDESRTEYEISRAIIKYRIAKKLTQGELAERMGTTQSVISRVEQAKGSPSISFLKRLATALDTKLQVNFK